MLKRFHSQYSPNHSHNTPTLAITNTIKHLFYFFCSMNWNLDGMRRSKRIKLHGIRQMPRRELIPHGPLWKDLICGPIFSPRRKSFIQPQIIPPCHGDKISKPLMSKFMRHHRTNSLLLTIGCLGRINQQIHLPISDQTPIFHSTHGKLRYGHHIQFRQRIRQTKEIIIGIQGLGRTFQCKHSTLGLTRRSIHLDQHPVPSLRLDMIKFTHTKCYKIRGHLG
mmetsp:Transcript_15121/g.28451  ORF Transcript_15121/g.28451 Transcript_15121/m.28451 type:complete len:222 (+) Transcript_15121:1500-2165(+)